MGEELRAAHAHRHRVVEELGVLGGHDQVARPDQHQAAGDHLALHQRHGRLGDVAPALAEAKVDLLLARVLRLRAGLAEARPRADRLVLAHVAVAVDLAQVVARGEVRAVGRQHDHLDRVVLRGAVEGVVQRVEERGVLRVPRVGAVEDDAGDARRQRLVEDGIGHGRLPFAWKPSASIGYCGVEAEIADLTGMASWRIQCQGIGQSEREGALQRGCRRGNADGALGFNYRGSEKAGVRSVEDFRRLRPHRGSYVVVLRGGPRQDDRRIETATGDPGQAGRPPLRRQRSGDDDLDQIALRHHRLHEGPDRPMARRHPRRPGLVEGRLVVVVGHHDLGLDDARAVQAGILQVLCR